MNKMTQNIGGISNSSSDKDNLLDVLTEILKWTKVTGMQQVKTILLDALDDGLKRTLYQLSDGSISIREIVSKYALQTNRSFIQKMWKQWSIIGIGESISVMGGGQRFIRSFDLDAFGIEYKIPIEANTDSGSNSKKNGNKNTDLQESLTEIEDE